MHIKNQVRFISETEDRYRIALFKANYLRFFLLPKQ